jgi:phage repressor protein C with HTH and peptisase S24 domain
MLDEQISKRDLPHSEEFVDRLRHLISIAGSASALAKSAGLSQSGFHRYLSGGEPSRRALVALAIAADVDLNWLATGEGKATRQPAREAEPDKASLTRLPLYKNSDIGPGIMAVHDGKNLPGIAFCRNWLGKQGLEAKQLAALQARGNSMDPTIRHGDSVLIDLAQTEILDGDIYAIRDGELPLLKRLQRQLSGNVRMICDNPMYPAIDCAQSSLNVLGKVVWRGSLF